MRIVLIAAAFATLAGCGETSETYPIEVSDAWSRLSGAAYSAAAFGVPIGLIGADVSASFESGASERTGYWKFSRRGKELGRLNVAVEGDAASSTVSYNYARGDVAAEDQRAERLVRQYAQPLITEAIDATIENRARDQQMKKTADVQSAAAMIGDMMKDVDKSLNSAVARFDEQDRQRKASKAHSQVVHARENSTKPTTDLSGY